MLFASVSGTVPGQYFNSVNLPLNVDVVFIASAGRRNGPVFVDTEATLATDGTHQARFSATPGLLNPLVGADLSFAFLTLHPIDFASNAVQVQVVP